jgi:caudovirus prohead protease
MRVKNVLVDENNNTISLSDLRKNAVQSEKRKYRVVYAHTDVVNDNGLKLNADSIEVTRDKYPLLFEHNDNRVEDVVGFITTTGEPNPSGEFVGDITFYATEQGAHAEKLWADGVLNELSVSYYIKDCEEIVNYENSESYLNVLKAVLKEVSIVSVGADRNTGLIGDVVDETDKIGEVEITDKHEEIEVEVENTQDEPTSVDNSPETVATSEDVVEKEYDEEDNDEKLVENDSSESEIDELDKIKLELLKKIAKSL